MKKKLKKKHRRKRPSSKAKTAQIVKAEPQKQVVKQYGYTREKVELIKRTVAKDLDDDELELFFWVAKKHHLDPLAKQIHAIKRNDRNQGRKVMTIQVGIDGYRTLAGRNKEFAGVGEPSYSFADDGRVVCAKIPVFRKGVPTPSVGIAFWDEYAPYDLNENWAFMWKKMPKHMLAKCAEALALRKAFPDLADIYTDEEMMQADSDVTPDGRQITDQSGAPLSDQRDSQRPEFKDGAARVDRQFNSPSAAQPAKRPEKKKIISLEWWLDGKFAAIRGDIEAIIPELKKWQSEYSNELGAWMLPGAYVSDLQAAVEKSDVYQLQEIQAKPGPLPKSSTPPQRQEPERKPAKGNAPVPPGTAAKSPSGSIVSKVEHKVSTGDAHKPYVSVFWKGEHYSCWIEDLWGYLDQAKGLECNFFTKKNGKFQNINGIDFIGSRRFENGSTPVIDVNEPRPAPGRLFA